MRNSRITNYIAFLFFYLILITTSIAGKRDSDNSTPVDNKTLVIKAHEMALKYDKSGKPKKAIAELEKIIEPAKTNGDVELLEKTYEYLISLHKKTGSLKKVEEYKNQLDLLKAMSEKKKLERRFKENEEAISQLQKQNKNTELEKQKTESELSKQTEALLLTKDSLQLLDTLNKESLAQINLLKKEKEIEALILKEKDARLKHQELEIKEREARQNLIMLVVIALVVGIIILIALAYFIYKNFKQKKKYSGQIEEQLNLIQHQHDNITNSINYASKIQNAMLPHERSFQNLLPDSFILFKPRDIVSGDFYWFYNVNGVDVHTDYNESAHSDIPSEFEKMIVVAADCTGHGVPGALMSMIGYNLLNVIVNKNIHEPDKILEELNRGIRFALQQHKSNNQDGMDIALCVIDHKNKMIEFAGAKNPMIVIQDGQLLHLKGDKHPIGGYQGETKRVYEKQTLPLKNDTYIYLFSDGYADQFGGPENKKFMIKNLKDLLQANYSKSFREQKEILNQTIENWKGTKEKQIDDILIMGMKVS